MIKEKIIICIVIAFLGSVSAFICKSIGKSNIVDAVEIVVGVLMLISVLAPTHNILNGIEINDTLFEKDYSKIGEDAIKRIVENTQSELEELFLSEIKNEFKIEGECEIKISSETFEIEEAKIYISPSDRAVSAYQIKMYFRNNYEVDVEVINV